jgi:type III secretion protein L
MSLGRARIIKAHVSSHQDGAPPARNATWPDGDATYARRVPAAVVDARDEANRIMGEASATAEAMMADAKASVEEHMRNAAREAREGEMARITAELVALRIGEEQRAERDLDRTIDIAVLLAERLVGDAIAHEPARVATLARGALEETRGARRMRIEACQDDVAALETMLAGLGEGSAGLATVEAVGGLARGSLIVHTELGRIDARLAPQLTRLAEALREALRTNPGSQRSSRE